MNDVSLKQTGQCECGDAQFSIQGEPLIRIYCHCTICQTFNDAAFGDVSIFLSKDVQVHNKDAIELKKYKRLMPVQRGKCVSCHKPAIEFLDLPVLPSLTIIPSENIPEGRALVEPSRHVFYDTRTSDVDDPLPKHSGFLKSQTALTAQLMSGMVRRLRKA